MDLHVQGALAMDGAKEVLPYRHHAPNRHGWGSILTLTLALPDMVGGPSSSSWGELQPWVWLRMSAPCGQGHQVKTVHRSGACDLTPGVGRRLGSGPVVGLGLDMYDFVRLMVRLRVIHIRVIRICCNSNCSSDFGCGVVCSSDFDCG